MSNPKPTDNHARVIRGGSWYSAGPAGVPADYRSAGTPSIRSSHVGFRTTLAGRTPR